MQSSQGCEISCPDFCMATVEFLHDSVISSNFLHEPNSTSQETNQIMSISGALDMARELGVDVILINEARQMKKVFISVGSETSCEVQLELPHTSAFCFHIEGPGPTTGQDSKCEGSVIATLIGKLKISPKRKVHIDDKV